MDENMTNIIAIGCRKALDFQRDKPTCFTVKYQKKIINQILTEVIFKSLKLEIKTTYHSPKEALKEATKELP